MIPTVQSAMSSDLVRRSILPQYSAAVFGGAGYLLLVHPHAHAVLSTGATAYVLLAGCVAVRQR